MPRHPLTRRQALQLAAGSAALGALGPAPALAAAAPDVFSMGLDVADDGALAAAAGAWRTTRVFAAPRRFDLIGLGWTRASRARAQLRTRPRGGRWSRWAELPAAGDHGPDAGSAPAGTEPAWCGAADEFQLRLQGSPRGLRARFVHAGPAARGRARATLAAARRRTPPAIIPRAGWGGDAVVPRAAPTYGQVQLAFVHHTVNLNDYGPEDSAAMVLGIAKYHRNHNGWNDLGYNFLVDRYGQVFEGRAGGVELAIVGAQAQGYNSYSTGIACLGTFTEVAQTEAGLDALARLIGWKLSLHGVPVQGAVTVSSLGGEANRYPAGTPVTFQRISGHRDGNTTECPGDVLYGQLADLRVRAARFASPIAGLTLRAATTRLRGAVPVALSGSLRFGDAASPAGARVSLYLASAGGAAGSPLATVTCGADGGWSTTLTLPQSGTLQARFAGDATHGPLESSPLTLTVVPTIELGLSASHLRRGRRLAVAGVVSPAADGVTVEVARKVRGRYRRVRTRRVAVRGGRYLTYLRQRRRGLYRVTVSVPGATERRYFRVT